MCDLRGRSWGTASTPCPAPPKTQVSQIEGCSGRHGGRMAARGGADHPPTPREHFQCARGHARPSSCHQPHSRWLPHTPVPLKSQVKKIVNVATSPRHDHATCNRSHRRQTPSHDASSTYLAWLGARSTAYVTCVVVLHAPRTGTAGVAKMTVGRVAHRGGCGPRRLRAPPGGLFGPVSEGPERAQERGQGAAGWLAWVRTAWTLRRRAPRGRRRGPLCFFAHLAAGLMRTLLKASCAEVRMRMLVLGL